MEVVDGEHSPTQTTGAENELTDPEHKLALARGLSALLDPPPSQKHDSLCPFRQWVPRSQGNPAVQGDFPAGRMK